MSDDGEFNPEDADMKRVREACEVLGEHFDSVQIFATRHEPNDGGTINVNWGMGNWFARKGQISEWLMKSDERAKREVRNED